MKESWEGRRVFVTGATGFVGSWLVATLVECRASVSALIRDSDPLSHLIRSNTVASIRVVNGHLEDYATLERALNEHEIDTVFHLGAQTIVGAALRGPLATFEANVRGTYNLLEACRRCRDMVKRIVVASSDKAYGISDVLPYTEDMSLSGRYPYDVSKSCADLLAQSYYHSYALPVVVARCGNIYGGGDLNWSRIVPGTIRSLWMGQRPIIRSDGSFTRDYVYIKDSVKAYMQMAQACDQSEVQGECFNFGPQRPQSVLEVANMVSTLMDREDLAPMVLNEAHKEIRHQYLSSGKAQRTFGWEPSYSLEMGLRETIDWYVKFLESDR